MIADSGMYGAIIGGENNQILGRYATAFGFGTVADIPGSMSFTGRQNYEPGDAQAVLFHLSTTTNNVWPKHMAVYGSQQTPVIPDSSVWAGQAHVVARRSDGTVSVWKLPIIAGRQGGAGWTAPDAEAEAVMDDLDLGDEAVSLAVNGDGRFRLLVRGHGGTDIRWGALVMVTQVR